MEDVLNNTYTEHAEDNDLVHQAKEEPKIENKKSLCNFTFLRKYHLK